VIGVKLKSKRKPKKPDVWVTEISVKDRNVRKSLQDLIKLVRKYEDLS
jgi:hypothetical protein